MNPASFFRSGKAQLLALFAIILVVQTGCKQQQESGYNYDYDKVDTVLTGTVQAQLTFAPKYLLPLTTTRQKE